MLYYEYRRKYIIINLTLIRITINLTSLNLLIIKLSITML